MADFYSLYNLARIAGMLPESLIISPDSTIEYLLTDSRSLTFPESTLFFAIETSTGDGHRYISSLYDRGVRNFVVRKLPDNIADYADANFIAVESPLKALQAVGEANRNRCDSTKVIAITGSCGKTVVKEWLNMLIGNDMKVARSPRSYNSRIGVPLSLWDMTPDHDLAIIEAGISVSGEMTALSRIIRPDIGIFTHLGPQHSEGFESEQAKADEKMKLFDSCEALVYNADDESVSAAVDRSKFSGKRLDWSTSGKDAYLKVTHIDRNRIDSTTSVSYEWSGGNGSFVIPFITDGSVENAISSLVAALYIGISPEHIAGRMKELKPVNTRLDVLEGVNDSILILDKYTSDLSSLASAIDFASRRLTPGRGLAVVVSDLNGDSTPPRQLYEKVARLMKSRSVSRLVAIGPKFCEYASLFGHGAEFYPDTASFSAHAVADDFSSYVVVVKGAPEFHFEEITDMLEARQHQTVLEVDLDAMISNFNWFKSHLKPTTGMICMIKASGYGAGALELAKTLQSCGAAYAAVAVTDEAIELRRGGVTMPIMVMNPRMDNYRAMFAHRLEPEVYSFELLEDMLRAARRHGCRNYPIHIKIDSGMHRLGFRLEEIPRLVEILNSQSELVPASVFSHLCVADCPEEDAYTMSQFEYFDRCADMLCERCGSHHILRHILNSTGIVRFPEHQYDMVRLGVGLYGQKTMWDGSQSGLRPVSALYTTVISTRRWPAGTTIGYGRHGLLKRESTVATIPVGYADGIDRHLGNGGMKVWINGSYCPTVGNICMDACMIDVTDVECHTGDRVEIFGPHINADVLAAGLDTINYEILTSVSDRVRRIYYRE